MSHLLWILAILGALSGVATLADTFKNADSAPKQAAGAAIAAALAIIPYVLARAVGEINGNPNGQLKRIGDHLERHTQMLASLANEGYERGVGVENTKGVTKEVGST